MVRKVTGFVESLPHDWIRGCTTMLQTETGKMGSENEIIRWGHFFEGWWEVKIRLEGGAKFTSVDFHGHYNLRQNET